MEHDKVGWPTRVQKQVLTALKPAPTVEARNTWNLYGDIAWYGILYGVITSFLSVFLLRLGGTDMQVGLLSSLPALVAIFASMPGGRMVEQERRPLSTLVISGVLHRSGYLAIGLLPFFSFIPQAWGVIILAALLTIPQAVANIAFTTMFARVVTPDRRAHIVAVRNAWLGITSTATALFGGYFLEWVIFPLNYQILLVIAFGTSMMSVYCLARLKMPPAPVSVPVRSRGTEQGPFGFFKMLHATPGFTRFTIVSFITQWGLFFSAPLYSIYWVRTLHASDMWVGLFSMVGSATTILSYPIWGRITARHGNRIAMIVTMAALAGYPFFLAFAPSVEWVLLIAFWGGIFSSGQALAFFNGLLELCPEQNRAALIAAYNTVLNAAVFAAPLMSTVLVDVYGIQIMLIVGAALRLLGAVSVWQQRVLAKTERAF